MGSFLVILLNAAAVIIHQAKVALRVGVALIGRPAEPANGLRVVLDYALAVLVHTAKTELCFCVALIG